MSAPVWMAETWRTYVGNAASVRDFRVQMRGYKTVAAWSVYLFVLLLVGFLAYQAIGFDQSVSIARAQTQLREFFGTIVRVVAGAVVVMAPGLTAASIAGERQRRSFDLVFSAPVTPKYYLVGKMLASYRYTLMLLLLALPVAALSASAGGATWGDILISFVMLSMSGLMMTAIALLVSSMQEKVHGAIAASYLIVIAYLFFTTYLSAALLFGRGFGGGGPIRELSFLATLNPFFVPESYGTYTLLLGREIPNWILQVVFSLLVVRLCLLGAGSALSPYGSAETKSLRINGLIYIALLGFFALQSQFSTGPITATSGATDAKALTAALAIVLLFIPGIAALGFNGKRINEPDGVFDPRRIWIATPAGAAPYLLALVAAFGVGGYLGARQVAVSTSALLATMVHAAGLVLFTAGLTRAVCSRLNFTSGRSTATGLTIGAVAVLPFFLTVQITSSAYGSGSFRSPADNDLWVLWPLWPLTLNHSENGLAAYGAVMGAFGLLMWFSSTWALERRRMR